MPLRIEVLKYRGHAVTEPVSVVFDREGGTVGRSADNTLVLPDDCVSRKHARISFQAGRYHLTDESANGTLIFNRDQLVHYDRVELDDGDIIRIGDYELGVTYEERVRNTHAVRVDRIPSRSRFEDERERDRPPEGREPAPPHKDGPSLFVKELSIDDFFRDTGDEIATPERGSDKKPPVNPNAPKQAPPVNPDAPKQAPPVKLNERKVDSLFKDIDDFFRDSVIIEAKDLAPKPEHGPERTFEKPRVGGLPPVKPERQGERPEASPDEEVQIAATGTFESISHPPVPPVQAPPVEVTPAPAPPVEVTPVEAPPAQSPPTRVPPVRVPPVKDVPAPEEAGTGMPAGEVPAPGIAENDAAGILEIQAELFKLFLKGARIEESDFFESAEIPELIETMGAVFRELTTGLYTVLRGRTELKAEFRLAMTMVRPFRNNPLKLSPRVEDALKRLLKRDHQSFLEPVDAVREGFEDIMNHQLAMNAGMRASLAEALDKFDPQRFAEKHKDASLFKTKGKSWKDYCDAYGDLREQAAEGIFGKAFIQAYEEQLEKLRAKQKKN